MLLRYVVDPDLLCHNLHSAGKIMDILIHLNEGIVMMQ